MKVAAVIIPSVVVFVAALVLAGTVLWTRAIIALEIDLSPDCSLDISLVDPSHAPNVTCALARLAFYSRCAQTTAGGTSVQSLRWVGEPNAALCVRFRSGAVAVAFRGTQTTEDAIVNMDTTLVQNPFHAGRVHRGFLERYQELRDELRHVLDGWNVCRTDLLVTGHSLGAALATLATFDWRPARAIVFGSPKVGDEVTAAGLEACGIFHAHVNLLDPVCTLPARGPYVAPIRSLVVFACDKGCWAQNHDIATYVYSVCDGMCGTAATVTLKSHVQTDWTGVNSRKVCDQPVSKQSRGATIFIASAAAADAGWGMPVRRSAT
jgi:hypothetical protein